MVRAGRGTQAESGGNQERGVAGCFRVWEGFLQGRCSWTSKKTEKEKVEGKGVQIFVFEDCGQWTLIAADISWVLSLCQALVQVVGIYEVI